MSNKFFILAIASLVSISSFAQQLNRVVLDNWIDGAWESKMQQLPFYDEDGRISKNEISHWNEDLGIWEDQTKTEFVRNEDGSLLTKETSKWSQDRNAWQQSMRASYTLTEKNKPSSVLTEGKNSEGWFNKSIEEYTYNENGKLILKQSERWDKQLVKWVPNRKIVYTVEAEKMTGYTIFFWDNKLTEWNPYKKAAYYYSKNESINKIEFDTWLDGEWQQHSIRRNIRNNEGVLNSMEVDNFDSETQIWEKTNHVDYELTDFGKLDHSLSKKWNDSSAEWDNLQRSTYHYSKEGNMIKDWQENEVEMFPNPTKEKLTIRSLPLGTITVIDALGKIVLQLDDNEEESIQLDVSEWEIGTYSVQVEGSEVQKFIKQ